MAKIFKFLFLVCIAFYETVVPISFSLATCPCESTDLVYGSSCFRLHNDTKSWVNAFNQCIAEAPTGSTGRLAWVLNWTLWNQMYQCFTFSNWPGNIWLGMRKTCNCTNARSQTYWWNNISTQAQPVTWALDNVTGGAIMQDEIFPCVRARLFMEWNDRDCINTFQYICEYGNLDNYYN